ncbi:MAG: hypothetical protein M1814_005389 [Vezdaea aestivalis]|nr:MAG: hypothetical protein M1814_005389 [Vezdaea aestivalis]
MSTDVLSSTALENIISDPVIAPDLPLAVHVRSSSDLTSRPPPPSNNPNTNRPHSAGVSSANMGTATADISHPFFSNGSTLFGSFAPDNINAAVEQLARQALQTDPKDVEPSIAALSQSSATDAPKTPFQPDGEISAPVHASCSFYQEGTSSIGAESDAHRIQAFAKLEFEDGQFYMNTHAIELGRDSRGEKTTARKSANNFEKPFANGERDWEAASNSQAKRNLILQTGESIVSGKGGIMGYDPSPEFAAIRRKQSSKRSKSSTSSAHQTSVRESSDFVNPHNGPGLIGIAPIGSQLATDPSSFLPSPDECPLIPIHPPVSVDGITSYKSISRRHVRIAFNFDKDIFELEVLGRNGAFVDEIWYPYKAIRGLRSGSIVQIGMVTFKFILPDLAVTQTDAEDSYSLEELERIFDSDEEDGEEEEEEEEEQDIEEDEDEDEEEEEVDEDGEPALPIPPPPPVKRGPGRPPKNGIMSKRREKELAREAAEAARSNQTLPRTKGKVAPGFVDTPAKPEKRKYTKRKSPVGEDGRPAKEKKPAKTPKPPRSPSPEFDRATLTEEQLQKPPHSYVVLIHDALTNSPSGAMTLPQIYRAIIRRYPYFKVTCETLGWQSSVRHNLSQHEAFCKIEKDGKGWQWGIVPGISIEKERKRRASPPIPKPVKVGTRPISKPGTSTEYQSPFGPASSLPPRIQEIQQAQQAQRAQQTAAAHSAPSSSQPQDLSTQPVAASGPPSYRGPRSFQTASASTTRPSPSARSAQSPSLPPNPANSVNTAGSASNESPNPTDQQTAKLLQTFTIYRTTMLPKVLVDKGATLAPLIVNSAICRALGQADRSSVTKPGEPEDRWEVNCIRGAMTFIPPALEPEVARRVAGGLGVLGSGVEQSSRKRSADLGEEGRGRKRMKSGEVE